MVKYGMYALYGKGTNVTISKLSTAVPVNNDEVRIDGCTG